MKWWILDGQVVSAALETGKPANFEEVDGPTASDRDAVYFDGVEVVLKPAPPTADAIWDNDLADWRSPVPAMPLNLPDWEGLVGTLRGGPILGKAYSAGDRTLKAQNAFSLMMVTLTGTKNLDDFVFSLERLREAMRGIAQVGDFTVEELEAIADLLSVNGFDSALFNLEPFNE